MLQLRLTVFRDKPDLDLLGKFASNGYNLFQDTKTDLYFLTDGHTSDLTRDGFGSDYHRVLGIRSDYDWSYLKTFKTNHKALLKHTIIHDEIVVDAIATSQAFSTRVLCVYGNDEDCDFAVTAEKGELLRLRFKGGREKGKRVDDAAARDIETEIRATRILMEGEAPSANEVFEYRSFEAIQTQDKPLALFPFWHFREGEIDGQYIFDTLSSTPDGTEPSFLFRNAFLEFETAFGTAAPDFTDLPEVGRFQRIAFQAPEKVSIFTAAFNFLTSLLALIASSRKAVLWTLGVLAVLAVAIFGKETEHPSERTNFEQNCASFGGAISGATGGKCVVENIAYRDWNLPGEKGERRIFILKIGPQQLPCAERVEGKCLSVEGEIFPHDIDGFIFRDGETQITPVERTQICDPLADGDCLKNSPIFEFRQLIALGK